MSASSASTVTKPQGPTEADVSAAVERSWQKRTAGAEKTGQKFTSRDMIDDVLDEFDDRGLDTGLFSIQMVLTRLVRQHLLLEDMAERIERERERGNVVQIRRS